MRALINTGGAGASGHVITNSAGTELEDREKLQFEGVQVSDDSLNNKTVVKPQIQICATETEWNQMSDAQKNDPLVYWYLPWAPDNVYSQDKTPVGTVITVATGKTGDGITGITTPINPFPNEDYLICNGNLVQISDYPQLANYFEEVYGDKFYFTNGVDPGNGRFQLPNWSADYPENGILCIKARITSDVITFAEVDETGLSSRTDEVPNCARVAKIEDTLFHNQLRDITSDIQSDNGARLFAAIAEQNLIKYGYAIGDYFESPADRTLKQQTGNASTETNATVRIRYTLADLDTYYGGYGYDAYAVLNTHHIAIVVDSKVSRQWHTGDASSVGYNDCTLKTFLEGTGTGQLMTAVNTDIIALFGSNRLLSHQKLFTTALASWGWQTGKYISALTESEIYGHREWSANGYQEGEAVKPLEVFQKYRWNQIFGNTWLWLRNLQAASVACGANHYGFASLNGVTATSRAVGLILLH